MKLSLIIVTYKSMQYMPALLESIKTYVRDEHEVIVVDNNSGDDIGTFLAQKYPEVKVVLNTTNGGYSRGMNQGFAISTGEYVAFMNPDMEFVMDPFARLISQFNSRPNFGFVAPQLRYADGSLQPTVKNSPSLWSQIWILFKLHHVYATRAVRNYWSHAFNYTVSQPAQHLMGAFLFTSRARALEIGLWDESYPLLWEDEDICEMAIKKGFQNYFCADVHVMHYEGRSFATVAAPAKQKRFNKGMRIYFKKHIGIFAYSVLLLLHPVSMILAYTVNFLKIKPRTQSSLQ
ncbi:glycosyltransferase family 2 protein [Candidatus Falkowbacteria bacterium]|nr:glycosyltransferase family 2 protein [Candidatus Falkowbacteria bacterium]